SYSRRRSSAEASTASASGVPIDSTPKPDARASSRLAARFLRKSSATAASGGPLCAGTEKFGVRWDTDTLDACAALCGVGWMADEPVPITATVLPVKSTPSFGQRPVCHVGPLKSAAPGMSGSLGTERHPVAITQ